MRHSTPRWFSGRVWGSVAVATVLLSGASACASSPATTSPPADDEPVQLELWDTDTRPARTENLEKLIDMFEAENPNITINYLGLPTDSYIQKIGTAIATNSTPDLVTPKASDIAALVAQDALAPLDDLFDEGGWSDKIDASMTESSRAASPDGKLYLTPATSLADVVYYRPDLIERAGIDAPSSWNDFFQAADSLTDASTGQFGYTIRGGAGFFAGFVEMVYPQAGVDAFFTKDGVSTLDDPAIIKATKRYVELYNTATAQSDLTADFKAMVAQFGSGQTAMLSHSIGSYPDHVRALGADAVAAVVPFPASNGDLVLTGRMTTGFAMFKSSEHQEAAEKFLEFTMSQEGNSFWAQASGYIPGNLEVQGEEWVAANPAIQAAVTAAQDPKATLLQQPYYLPEFNSITGTDLLPRWQSVLQGELSVEDFLKEGADALTEAQQRYLSSQ